MPCPWFQRQESPENPPGKYLPNKTSTYVLRACTKYMYLNVIVCTPGGDHPEAERPVSIPTTSTSTSTSICPKKTFKLQFDSCLAAVKFLT